MKKNKILMALALATLLTGCSNHTLNHHSKTQNETFLIQAAQFAEKQMNLKNNPPGIVYYECMSSKIIDEKTCDNLYSKMLGYAKKSKDYSSLTLADIKDDVYWNSIKNDYQKTLFNSI